MTSAWSFRNADGILITAGFIIGVVASVVWNPWVGLAIALTVAGFVTWLEQNVEPLPPSRGPQQ